MTNGGEDLRFAWVLVGSKSTEYRQSCGTIPSTTPCPEHVHTQERPPEFIVMEDDRAQVDVGAAMNVELAADQQEQSRRPRRRFVGRKTAAAQAGSNIGTIGSVENSGAIQGM